MGYTPLPFLSLPLSPLPLPLSLIPSLPSLYLALPRSLSPSLPPSPSLLSPHPPIPLNGFESM